MDFINIIGTLFDNSVNHVVALANQIKDLRLNKHQQDINEDIYNQIDRIERKKDKCKGYFDSYQSLTSNFSSPEIGDWAIVKNSENNKNYVYKCSTQGIWSTDSEEYDQSLNLEEYVRKDNLKTINGQSLIGNDNLEVGQYNPANNDENGLMSNLHYTYLEELRVTKLPKLERDISNILSILDTENSSEQIQAIINKYNQISEFIQNLGDDNDSEEALSNIITRISNLENDISRLNRLIENIHVGDSSTGGMKHIILTESQYDALEEYEEDALYLITEDEEGWVFPIILQEVEQTFPIELI